MVLASLVGLVVAPAASARLSVSIQENAFDDLPGKILLIEGDTANDTVRVRQEDSATARRISVLGQGTVGNGCSQIISSPARIRCETDGIVAIAVLTSPDDQSGDPTAEVNTVDLTGVTQLGPDNAPIVDAIAGGPGPDVIAGGAG